MSDQLESGSESVDEAVTEPSVSPDGETSEPSIADEDALADKIADKVLGSERFEKTVQRHTNREGANARKRLENLEGAADPDLLERYQAYIDEGMKPAEAKKALQVDALIAAGSGIVAPADEPVADPQSDSEAGLSNEDAAKVASALLERIGVPEEVKTNILTAVGNRMRWSTESSVEDMVLHEAGALMRRSEKVSGSQLPISQGSTVTPVAPEKMDELRKAYEKAIADAQASGATPDMIVELRQRYRNQGLTL